MSAQPPALLTPSAVPGAEPPVATVRPLSLDEVNDLALTGGSIPVYEVTEHEEGYTFLVPATLSVDTDAFRRGPQPIPGFLSDEPVFATEVFPVDEKGFIVKNQPAIGLSVRVTVLDMFGAETSGSLQTTPAAEGRTFATPTRQALRERIAVPDPDGVALPLVVLWGSSVNLTAFIPNLDPDDVLTVVRKALTDAFGQDRITFRRFSARSVEDHRVDVLDTATGEAMARDVLAAEASYLANQSSWRSQTVPRDVPRGAR